MREVFRAHEHRNGVLFSNIIRKLQRKQKRAWLLQCDSDLFKATFLGPDPPMHAHVLPPGGTTLRHLWT